MYATKYNVGKSAIEITFGDIDDAIAGATMSDGRLTFTKSFEKEFGTFFGWTFDKLLAMPDGKFNAPKAGHVVDEG